jgi:hypothetical protein
MLSLLVLVSVPSFFALQQADGAAAPARPDPARVEDLRARIHEMRTNLLLGGEKVRQAESDAAQFYRGKVEVIEQRLDSIAAELAERRASYQVALEHALAPGDGRAAALREASEQRGHIQVLEAEEAELSQRSARVSKLVGAVEARGRERERLATKVESSVDETSALAFPMSAIGLAPEAGITRASSPLEDETLVADLLALDPRAGRKLLFETDPTGYWKRFPLRPPLEVLRRAIPFPPADLPGQR